MLDIIFSYVIKCSYYFFYPAEKSRTWNFNSMPHPSILEDCGSTKRIALIFVMNALVAYCLMFCFLTYVRDEPRTEPSSKWCSHKHKSAGLAYELGIRVLKAKFRL
jgi:hypothetical protein